MRDARVSQWLHPGKTDVDAEAGLVEERALALGRVGRRLEEALAAYHAATAAGPLPPAEEAELVDRVAARLYALLVQRDCAGAGHDNLSAIRAAYDIPEAALRRL